LTVNKLPIKYTDGVLPVLESREGIENMEMGTRDLQIGENSGSEFEEASPQSSEHKKESEGNFFCFFFGFFLIFYTYIHIMTL
jgi:hypothetical protein